jgi:hypothetical protein
MISPLLTDEIVLGQYNGKNLSFSQSEQKYTLKSRILHIAGAISFSGALAACSFSGDSTPVATALPEQSASPVATSIISSASQDNAVTQVPLPQITLTERETDGLNTEQFDPSTPKCVDAEGGLSFFDMNTLEKIAVVPYLPDRVAVAIERLATQEENNKLNKARYNDPQKVGTWAVVKYNTSDGRFFTGYAAVNVQMPSGIFRYLVDLGSNPQKPCESPATSTFPNGERNLHDVP